MGENDSRGVVEKHPPHHLPRMDAGPVDSAAEQLLEADDTMTVVQEQAGEHLAGVRPQPCLQKIAGTIGAVQHRLTFQGGFQVAPAQFQRRLELHVLGLAQAAAATQRAALRFQQRAQAVEAVEQIAGEVHGGRAGCAGAQKDGEQLRVRQSRASLEQELFARAFPRGPVGDGHTNLLVRVENWIPVTKL